MLQKVRGVFAQFGIFVGLLYGLDRLLRQFSSQLRLYVYDLMVQPILAEPLVPPRFTRSIEIREIKRGDPAVELMPPPAEIKKARFDQDAICLGAFKNGHFIGYIWFCFRRYDEDEVRCTYVVMPQSEAVFDFDLYIYPEHRLSFAFAAIWNAANSYLTQRGIRYTFSRLTRFNVESRRAHDRLGWKPVGRAVFLRAWTAELMMASVFPYLHLSVEPAKRVRLELHPSPLLQQKQA